MKNLSAILTAVLTAGAMTSVAGDLHIPQVRLPLMKTPPVIDGAVHEDEWGGAARMERFGGGGLLSPQEASFWVGSDGKELFIAVVSETPPDGKILAHVQPMPEDGDARTWLDDSIELVLDPLRTDTTSRRRLYHANLNALGAINDTAFIPNGTGEAWRGHWRIANKIIGDRWHFEAALPLADMKVTDTDLAQPFGVRICRNWLQQSIGPVQTEWGAIAGPYLNPATIPVVTWDEQAPVVQVLQLHDPGQLSYHPRVAIRNPHSTPLEVKVLLQCVPKNSAPSKLEQTVKIAPHAVETVELTSGAVAGEQVYGLIEVTSPDGSAVYYLRDFNCKLARPAAMWTLDQDAAKKVDVKFAYYPYHDTIKTVVNVTGLQERDQVRGVTVSVRAKGATKPLATTKLPALHNFATETEWKIPALNEGNYQFVTDLEGVKTEPVVMDFVRHVFPWEHNKLGKSDLVIEPFTPIKVQGRKVTTVLRTYTLNKLGLFDQIESEGQPLLKSPMRLEVNGQTVTGKSLRFVKKSKARVVTESKWSAGTTRTEWDYDGMMKWTLDLPASKQTMESMTLVIPLANKLMPLFHACTDGIRFNYAGFTPAGQGRVWDGSQAARNSIIGSYVPYIWVGAEERGLAVFGENDRGWGRAPKIPCQELVRNGDTLELRLNLIAAPTKLDQPRRIVIGFQATPTKPMPAGWRTWTMACGKRDGETLDFGWLGAGFYWGALTPCADVYPRNEDFSIYTQFAETRRTGKIDQEFVKQWLAGYPAAATNVAQNSYNSTFDNLYPPHINSGFGTMSSRPQRVIVYTNARGARFDTPEGQTFVDEWQRDAFNPHVAATDYDLNPVASFRDYALWYYQKMFDTYDPDIYWDNIFLQSCFDTVGTAAYELPDGSIQPTSGLFEMRALIRRTAVSQSEQNKRGYNMVHMTNTGIAPILSFASLLFTWEDRNGDMDFQDRFSRDYIRAESIGRQHGNVPFSLTLFSGAPDDPKNVWILRTAAGVALTHEIKPHAAPRHPAYWSNYLRLLDLGYGKPETRVWNYWDENYPVHIAGSETSSLLVSQPGRAIIVVCDYGNGGDLKLTLDLFPGFTAKDMESGQPLIVTGNTTQFALKKHDFKIILVEMTR